MCLVPGSTVYRLFKYVLFLEGVCPIVRSFMIALKEVAELQTLSRLFETLKIPILRKNLHMTECITVYIEYRVSLCCNI